MENQPDKKDYEEYLSQIEKSLSSGNRDNRQISSPQKTNTKRNKISKRKVLAFRAFLFRIFALVLLITLIVGIIFTVKSCKKAKKPESAVQESKSTSAEKTEVPKKNFFAKTDEGVSDPGGEINSRAVVFIDVNSNKVVAGRNMFEKMYPASTTKIMTLLVAVENIADYNDTFKMTYQITDPLFKEGATVAGFSAGEVLTVYDLLYGTVLPSGGDGAIGLAEKIAGSENEFIKLMNDKVRELGLSATHFANCTGLFDKENYTTAYDLSVILRAAMDNPLCKKILSTQKYTTSKTDKHPDGLELENTLFKYMYGTEPETAVITGGKTGFVSESGYCIASFGENTGGDEFVCVTLYADSRWPAVYDQINLYKEYSKGE